MNQLLDQDQDLGFPLGKGQGKNTLTVQVNKANAISAELLELNLKNKLEETGKTRWNGKKQEETEKLEEKKTKNRQRLERSKKKQEETGRNSKKQ